MGLVFLVTMDKRLIEAARAFLFRKKCNWIKERCLPVLKELLHQVKAKCNFSHI